MLSALQTSSIGRGIANFAFRHFARQRTRQVDERDFARVQESTLLGLLCKGRNTRFGDQHGFRTIRTIDDYQRQVPLRTYEGFSREYWGRDAAEGTISTWPHAAPYWALSSGTTSGVTKYIPVTREMLKSNRRAALTSLAWAVNANCALPPFSGQMFMLGGSTDLSPSNHAFALKGDLSGIAAKEIPFFAQPYTFPPLELAHETDWDKKLNTLAKRSASLPIAVLSGVPSWMLALADQLRRMTGKATLKEIWPSLQLVIHGGTGFDAYRSLFREVVGDDDVQFQEVYPASEGFIAAEDPRYQMLRVIPDHGIFYEFVPIAELESRAPTRHTLSEVVAGIHYAVVLTTCAGLWSYILGDTVCFESTNPPLLRLTGRTKQFLSAFGEHLIVEEVEKAIALASERTGAAIADFHAGPKFPEQLGEVGRHLFYVEFVRQPVSHERFTLLLDDELKRLNEDYRAHRFGDLTIGLPEVCVMPRGGFADWMRSRGKLGGQHKAPRLDSTGALTADILHFCQTEIANSAYSPTFLV